MKGSRWAEWLNQLGGRGLHPEVPARGRVTTTPVMLQDAGRAIRTVRARAGEWQLDPDRVAILGFSRGGAPGLDGRHALRRGATRARGSDRAGSARGPSRLILVYPVISLNTPYVPHGSRRNLLGESPPDELVASLSNETQVTPLTPPTFLVHTNEDTSVPPENSICSPWGSGRRRSHWSCTSSRRGGTAWAWAGDSPASKPSDKPEGFKAWPALCETWLRGQGFLTRSPSD